MVKDQLSSKSINASCSQFLSTAISVTGNGKPANAKLYTSYQNWVQFERLNNL